MTTEILILALGMISSTTLVISALSTHKTRLIIFSLITSVLVIAQFSITGALVGLGACIVGIIRLSTVLASNKWGWLNHWLMIPIFITAHAVMFAFMNDWSNVEFYNFVPVVGSMLAVIALYFSDLIYTKSIFILVGSMWLFYEFSVGSYGHMIGETLTIMANIVALFFLIKAARKGVEVVEPAEEFIKVITTSIPIITTNIPIITTSMINTMTGQIPVIRKEKVFTQQIPVLKKENVSTQTIPVTLPF